jgi:hypothetical protein
MRRVFLVLWHFVISDVSPLPSHFLFWGWWLYDVTNGEARDATILHG